MMSSFRLALIPFLLSVAVQAATPDNVSSRLMIHVSFLNWPWVVPTQKKEFAILLNNICHIVFNLNKQNVDSLS
jgi:hypothetical protein